jgi:hypothetical protein
MATFNLFNEYKKLKFFGALAAAWSPPADKYRRLELKGRKIKSHSLAAWQLGSLAAW